MGGHKHVSERCFGDSDKCDRDYPRAVGIRGGCSSEPEWWERFHQPMTEWDY